MFLQTFSASSSTALFFGSLAHSLSANPAFSNIVPLVATRLYSFQTGAVSATLDTYATFATGFLRTSYSLCTASAQSSILDISDSPSDNFGSTNCPKPSTNTPLIFVKDSTAAVTSACTPDSATFFSNRRFRTVVARTFFSLSLFFALTKRLFTALATPPLDFNNCPESASIFSSKSALSFVKA